MSSILISRFLMRVREVGSYTMFDSRLGTFSSVRCRNDVSLRVNVPGTTLEFRHEEIGEATTPGSDRSHLGSGMSGANVGGSCLDGLDWEIEQEDVDRAVDPAMLSFRHV